MQEARRRPTRRAAAGLLAGGAVVVCAVPGCLGGAVIATAATCSAPVVSGIEVQSSPGAALQSRQDGYAGSVVTVTGSGFVAAGCTLAVSVGPAAAQPQNVTATSFHFTSADGMSGRLAVSLVDAQRQSATDDHLVYITIPPNIPRLGNADAGAGQQNTFLDSGLDFHLPSGWEQVSTTFTLAGGATCSDVAAQAPALNSDTTVTFTMPGRSCDAGTVTLTLSAPRDATHTGPGDPRITESLSHDFVMPSHVDSMSPNPAAPGQAVTVTGYGFGAGTGGGSIGQSTALWPTSWSDTRIVFAVPDGARTGVVDLVTRDQGRNFSPGTLTVAAPSAAGHSPTAAPSPSASPSAGATQPSATAGPTPDAAAASSPLASDPATGVPAGRTASALAQDSPASGPPAGLIAAFAVLLLLGAGGGVAWFRLRTSRR